MSLLHIVLTKYFGTVSLKLGRILVGLAEQCQQVPMGDLRCLA